MAFTAELLDDVKNTRTVKLNLFHAIVTLILSLDYTYYESLASQQQCQISCCLITHPPEVPSTVCEWSDMAVGAQIPSDRLQNFQTLPNSEFLVFQQQPWPQVMPDVPLGHTALSESPHFISVLPPPRSSKGSDF